MKYRGRLESRPGAKIIPVVGFSCDVFIGYAGRIYGAGGAGLVIKVLTMAFGIPIHATLGTSLGAVMFLIMSGLDSYFRGKNVVLPKPEGTYHKKFALTDDARLYIVDIILIGSVRCHQMMAL